MLAVISLGVEVLPKWDAAIRDALGPNRLVVPLQVDNATLAQVFFDVGNGIRAEDVATVAVTPSTELREVSFPLPRRTIRELRFDPMVGGGRFSVGTPRYTSASGRLIAQFPFTAVVPRYQIRRFTAVGDRWQGEAVEDANDPQLTFELGRPLTPGRPRYPWNLSLAFVASALVLLLAARLPANAEPLRGGRSFVGRFAEADGCWRTWHVVLGALLVAGVQLHLVCPLQSTIDLPLWDEVNYAAAGRQWLLGTLAPVPFHSSPAYAALYAQLNRLGSLPEAIYAQHYLLKIGTAVLFYFVLVRWLRSPLAATAGALVWGMAAYNLDAVLLVYHAAFWWFLAALAVVDAFPLLGLGCVLLATCNRQEYQFAAAALLAWLGWRAWRERWRPRQLLCSGGGKLRLGLAVFGGVALVALLVDIGRHSKSGSEGARAWFAFQQHYTLRAVQTGAVSGLNPLLDFPQVMERDFPGARSLSGAYHVNPAAFRRHVIANVLAAPGEVWRTVAPHSGTALAASTAALACLLLLRRRPAPSSAGAADCSSSIVLALSTVIVVAPGLIVLATSRYLLPLVPLAFGVVALIARRAHEWTDRQTARRVAGTVAASIALALALMQARAFVPGSTPRPVAESLQTIRPLLPPGSGHVLIGVSATSYAHYFGDENWTGIERFSEAAGASGRSLTFGDLVARTHPTAVIVTQEWTWSPRFQADQVAAVLPAPEWREIRIAAGQLYLRTGAVTP